MKRNNRRNGLVLILILISVYSCIETFFPQLPNKTGYLVIDALITNEARSYDVYLTRSITALNSKVTYVKGAYVSITDTTGKEYLLQEISTGHYVTDLNKFKGQVGNKYILHVKTGIDEYRSDTCKMYGTSKIDRLFIGKSSKFTENGIAEQDGMSLYLDGEVNDKNSSYLRWDFNEVWEFAASYPSMYTFSAPSTFTFIEPKNRYCWKNAKSSDIVLHSFQDQDKGVIKNKEIAFFLTNVTDRFTLRYSVLVNQYSISRKEYEFWNMLMASNQNGGGIFEKQPYSLSGNIHNLRNPDEVVLGYFQVSGIASQRIFIDPKDIINLKLMVMGNPCGTKTYIFGDPGDTGPFTSLKQINDYIIKHDSVLVVPYWNDNGALVGMTATSKPCSDCSLTGDLNKPTFWVDPVYK